MPNWFPKWFYHFTLPSTECEFLLLRASPMFIRLFNFSDSGRCVVSSVTLRFHFHFPFLLATRRQLYEITCQVSRLFSLLDFVFFLLIWKEPFKCSEYKPSFSYTLSKHLLPLLSCLSLFSSWMHKR